MSEHGVVNTAHTQIDRHETAYDLGLGAGLAPDLDLRNPYLYDAPEYGAWEQGKATGEKLLTEHLLADDSV